MLFMVVLKDMVVVKTSVSEGGRKFPVVAAVVKIHKRVVSLLDELF